MALVHFRAIEVGDRRQLFIDEKFFAAKDGVKLAVNPPVECGPAIEEDTPWEKGQIFGYTCILQDPLGDGVHRLFYWTGRRPPVLTAISSDGIHWEKPALGLCELDGSKENNALPVRDIKTGELRDDIPVMYPFVDPHDVPERRLKAFARHMEGQKPVLAWSGDGVHWETDGELLNDLSTDGREVIFWDDRIGKYVLYGRGHGRSISRIELDTLTRWPVYRLEDVVMRTDYYDNYAERLDGPMLMSRAGIKHLWETLKPFPWKHKEWDPDLPESPAFTWRREWADGVDIYEPATTKYPYAENIYLSPLNMFYHKPNLLELQLAVSRDGVDWSRPGDRQPWVRMPFDEEGVHCVRVGPGLIRNGNEMYHYIGHRFNWHGSVSPEDAHLDTLPEYESGGKIHRMKVRLDGYISADAGNRESGFTTPPLIFEGSRLVLNVDTSASGHVRVEMLDAWTDSERDLASVALGYNAPGRGMPIRGLTLTECERITCNSCHRIVAWNGSPDVSAWRGKPIRLRFSMRNAKLYAFQFAG